MIELSARPASGSPRQIKIFGVGGAGANALDRMALDGVNPCQLVAVNSDAQALAGSVAGEKLQLGRAATRGMGCGGDPEQGRAAAEEAMPELRAALDGLHCVFLLAGLGGGTGSGATPLIAELARESGALVIAVITLPFAFEKRRVQQAAEALAAIQQHADAVVCFENDRMADLVSPKAGIQQAFATADQTISQSVRAIVALLNRDGLIHLGFDDLRAALHPAGGISPRCLFGFGEAEGGNRLYDALARALKNPLMDRGRLLRECNSVLVQVSGGPDLTLNEVQLLMEEFNRHVDARTRILFGVAVAPELVGLLTVTVISSLDAEEPATGAGESATLSSSPLRELAEREARRLAALAAAESAVPTVKHVRMEPPMEEPEASEPASPVEAGEPVAGSASDGPPEWEYAAEGTDSVEAPAAGAEARGEEVEPEFIATEQDGVGAGVGASESVPVGEPSEATSETAMPAGETPEEPAAEPVAEPAKAPSRRRIDDRQASLFGDEPKPRSALPGTVPSPTRIAKPIPGRTLQPGVARMPVRRPEPPVEPQPEPKPEAKVEAKVEAPEPVRVDPAPEPVLQPEPVAASNEPVEPVVLTPPPLPVARPVPGTAAAPRTPMPKTPIVPAIPAVPPPGKSPLQETLQFEPASRGRFDKSEPTIVDGQDLDVPTFLRRNVRVR